MGPSGIKLDKDFTLDLPYNGDRPLEDVRAYWFDSVLCRWFNLDIEQIDDQVVPPTLQVKKDHLGLYALAGPSALTKALAGVGPDPAQQVSAYRLMSFGVNPAEVSSMVDILSTPDNLGEYKDNIWRLFAFDAEKQGTLDSDQYYVEGPAFGERFALAPGQAWWVTVRNDETVSVPGLITDPERDWYTTLVPGWNSLGNPYNATVDWTQTRCAGSDGVWYTFNQAGNPLDGELLYDYDPANAGPTSGGYVTRPQMANMVAYFVFNPAGESVQLQIPVDAVGQMAPGLAAKPSADKAMADQVLRTPPSPPTVAGDNPGMSVDSPGADSAVASGGGSCFVEASSQNQSNGAWMFLMVLILAMAARMVFSAKRGG